MARLAATIDRHPRVRRDEASDFRLIYLVSFVFFLVAAIIGRLLPGRRKAVRYGAPRSIFGEARAAAETAIPFAFMG